MELGSDYPITALSAGYAGSDPQLLNLGDGKLLACYVAQADKPDALALTARYYDGETWSDPICVEDNGTADLYPTASDLSTRRHGPAGARSGRFGESAAGGLARKRAGGLVRIFRRRGAYGAL